MYTETLSHIAVKSVATQIRICLYNVTVPITDTLVPIIERKYSIHRMYVYIFIITLKRLVIGTRSAIGTVTLNLANKLI